MRLLLEAPQLPSCADCKKWVYDLKTGERSMRNGNPAERPPESTLPCASCPKSEDDKPNPGAELTDRNFRCYSHYLECKAVGSFPDDPLVRRHAALIRRVEDQHAARRQGQTERLQNLVLQKLLTGGVRR